MIPLNKLTTFLDDYLKIKEISDGFSLNGLQVEGNPEIKNIAVCVDACLTSFKKAKKEINADIIICHHGLLRQNSLMITGRHYQRIKYLIKNDISLYGVHLPLDAHSQIGNNREFFKLLNIDNLEPLSTHDNYPMGYLGKSKTETSLKDLQQIIDEKLNTKSRILKFNNKPIKTIAFASGAGGYFIDFAQEKKADVYITGEISHTDYLQAQDIDLNIITAGHYATETLGVKALGKVLEKEFDVNVDFIDAPTEM